MFEETGNLRNLGNTYLELGRLQSAQGKKDNAGESFKRAVGIFKQTGALAAAKQIEKMLESNDL